MSRRPTGISDDLRRAGLMPDALPDFSGTNARGEGVDPTVDRRTADLSGEEVGFLREGGWTAVSIKGDGGGGGLTSHRGVLHPDEYVDSETLRALVENELGFTYAEIHSVYRRGPVAGDDLVLRGRIDARVLELSEEGGNMAELGRALGFAINDHGTCRTLDNALARARAEVGA